MSLTSHSSKRSTLLQPQLPPSREGLKPQQESRSIISLPVQGLPFLKPTPWDTSLAERMTTRSAPPADGRMTELLSGSQPSPTDSASEQQPEPTTTWVQS